MIPVFVEKPKSRLRIVKKANNSKKFAPQKGDITKDYLYQGSGWMEL